MLGKAAFLLTLLLLAEGSLLAQGDPSSRRAIHQRIDEEAGRTPDLVITGRLAFEDDSPPPSSLPVELLCNGSIAKKTFSNTQGIFRFELGETPADISDPAVGQGSYRIGLGGTAQETPGGQAITAGDYHHRIFRRVDLSGCEVRLDPGVGYVTNVIRLGVRGALDSPDIGVITLEEPPEGRGTTVSLTTLTAPDSARKAYEEAGKKMAESPPDYVAAAENLEKAVEEYPPFAAAWELLARLYLTRGNVGGAVEAFQQAIDSDEEFLSPYLGLAQVRLEQEEWQKARELTKRAIELNPRQPRAYYLHGLANYYLGQMTQAEDSFHFLEEGAQLRSYPLAALHLGIIRASTGKAAEAVQLFRIYMETMPAGRIPNWHRDRIREQVNQWVEDGSIDGEDLSFLEVADE